MTSASTQIKKSPIHDILNWSAIRPEWQRDALRRIIEKGQIDDVDIVELERISRAKLTMEEVKPEPMAAVPLSVDHLPPAPGLATSVSLLSLSNLKNVNRLADGASLPFGEGNGLTIIYGENGAGKSSYARVIKKACRARGAPPNIVPNAFVPSATSKPTTAEIAFRLGDSDISVLWKNDVVADSRLANIFVFDSFSADHYVSNDSTAAFTPHGLDVLPTLSKVCDVLAERLKVDISSVQKEISNAAANWEYDINTDVGKFIQKLSSTTLAMQINNIASLDQKQTQRLNDLREALKADPQQKAKETRASIARVEIFIGKITNASIGLAEENTKKVKQQLEYAQASLSTAKAFASGQFDSSFLIGTGFDLWRSLWDAAREYSEIDAYANDEFPVLTAGAACVLCQQQLDGEAVERFSRFHAFCQNNSLKLSENAEKLLQESEKTVNLLFPLQPELQKIDADIASLSSENILNLLDFVTKSDARLQILKQNIASRTWTDLAEHPLSPEEILRAFVSNLDGRAKTEESAHDPETRKKLIQELKELEAREWLETIKDKVSEQVVRYRVIAELEECKKDFSTSQVTAKSTELTKQFVTDTFQQSFSEELQKLGLRTLKVKLEPIQGQKGETKFGLRLVSAESGRVSDIASEGEQRCISLAAFLSELSQASHQSALVFDDPVSSLDHWHREKIAERLVAESKQRQVIVFTHDVVFLNDLVSFAEQAMKEPKVLTLEWNNGAPGRYVEGLPWDSKKPLDCLTELEKDQKEIATKWNPQPNGANIEDMRHAYSRLRSTLERIVEVELLDGIVCRFQSQVNAGKVRSLIGVSQGECDEIKRLLNKCHQITDAHAPSAVPIPDPTALTKDIADARKLITDIKQRKKQNQNLAGTL